MPCMRSQNDCSCREVLLAWPDLVLSGSLCAVSLKVSCVWNLKCHTIKINLQQFGRCHAPKNLVCVTKIYCLKIYA